MGFCRRSLETTSLYPPQAALRRFPRNDTVQGSVDFIGLLKSIGACGS